jgi:hypothetical protein
VLFFVQDVGNPVDSQSGLYGADEPLDRLAAIGRLGIGDKRSVAPRLSRAVLGADAGALPVEVNPLLFGSLEVLQD